MASRDSTVNVDRTREQRRYILQEFCSVPAKLSVLIKSTSASRSAFHMAGVSAVAHSRIRRAVRVSLGDNLLQLLALRLRELRLRRASESASSNCR